MENTMQQKTYTQQEFDDTSLSHKIKFIKKEICKVREEIKELRNKILNNNKKGL